MKKNMRLKSIFFMATVFLSFNIQSSAQVKRLTWTAGDSSYAKMTIDSSNNIHMTYVDDTYGYPQNEVYYKMSSDNGVTWPVSKRLTWNSGNSWNPEITVDLNGYIYIAWSDDTTGNEEIFYRKSTDTGATWSSTKRLTWNSGNSRDPVITTDTNNFIYIFWSDNTSGNNEIYYRKSINGGTSWESTKRLTWTSSSARPEIVTDNNDNVYAFWLSYVSSAWGSEIFFKKSINGGTSWSQPKRLTWGAGEWIGPWTFRVTIVADKIQLAYINTYFEFSWNR